MSLNVDTAIKNILPWVPTVGRITCTAACIEFVTRLIANYNRVDRLSKTPIISRLLTTTFGNRAASKVDKLTGTKTAPETLTRLFLFNLAFASISGYCARTQRLGAASFGLVLLVTHTIFSRNPLLGWHSIQKPLRRYKKAIVASGATALGIALIFKKQLQPYIALLK